MHVINETKNMLKNHFDMKDLGEANFILGMKITKTRDGIFLNQSHYVGKILRKYNFHDHKSVATPFDSSVHLFPVTFLIKRIMLASLVICVMPLIVLYLTLHMQQECLVDLLASLVKIIG